MKKKIKLFVFEILLVVGLCALFVPGNGTHAAAKGSPQEEPPAATSSPSVNTDQIIISYKSNSQAFKNPSGDSLMTGVTQAAGVPLRYLRSMSGNAHVLKLPDRMPPDQVQTIIEKLAALSYVAYAEPDQIRFPTLTPNDTYYSSQWDFFNANGGINVQPAWDITTGSSSIVAAIADTGLTNHVDLAGRMVSGVVATSGYDFISAFLPPADSLVANDGDGRDSDPSDPGDWITYTESHTLGGFFEGCPVGDSSWHGTHVAGTIGAASNNSLGVAGINWNSKLLIVRVLGKCGGYDSDIIDGITWAAGLSVSGVPANANPAKVINLSLGGPGACDTAWQTAINNINAAGAVIAVAGGNDSANVSGYTPASCNGVITVAATGKTGSLASYSNYGSGVEISAPGGSGANGILSTLNSGTTGPVPSPEGDIYVNYLGTSMATPHITGVVSLMFSVNPSLTPALVLQILQGTARAFPGGSTCNTSICGSGIVDASAAVNAARPTGAFSKTSPANGASGQPINPALNWGSSARATGYSYCIDTVNNSTCDVSWVSVGNNTTASPSGLLHNTPYYWQVRASNGYVTTDADTNTWGSFTTLQDTYSLNVSLTGAGGGTVTSSPPGIDCGLTCSASFNSGSSVTLTAAANSASTFTGWSDSGCPGTGTCTVTMDGAKSVTATFTHTWQTWYLAEGFTGAGFGTYILIQNPNTSTANVTLTYMPQGGAAFTRNVTVPGNSRYTVVAQDVDQVGPDQAFSTKLDSDQPIIVERAMYWPNGVDSVAGHVTTGFNSPANTWYLAEGFTGAGFGTYILIQNPNTSTANVTLTYMPQGGAAFTRNVAVPGNSRYTVVAQDVDQVGPDQAFSTKLDSDQPIIVERAMYFNNEGHDAGGVTAPQTTWYLAEGFTGAGFGTYILIQNPNTSTANVTLTYMPQGGAAFTRNVAVPGNSRYTVVAQDVDQVGPDQAFSTMLTSDQPIIVERAMYWPNGVDSVAGHDSSAASSAGNTWYLAEGFTGAGFGTYILIQNPNTSTANVTLTYMLQGGGTLTSNVSVPGNSRYTVVAQDVDQVGPDQAFSTKLVSDQPIIVERAMYFNNGGHDTLGVMEP